MDVKRYIKKHGFTQASLAERLGVHKNTVNNWVRQGIVPRWVRRWLEQRESTGVAVFDEQPLTTQQWLANQAKFMEQTLTKAKKLDKKRRLRWLMRKSG